MFSWLIVFVVTILENILHYEDDVFDKLSVRLVDHHLARVIEKLFNQGLNLIKENRVKSGSHFMAHQFFNVLLNLSAELLVGA